MKRLEQYLEELTEKAYAFLEREYNFNLLDISRFEAINFYLLHQAISEEKNLFIRINDKKYKSEIYRPSFLTIAILLFFKNYCDDVTAYNPGDILQKEKIRYTYVRQNLDGTHHIIGPKGAEYKNVSAKKIKLYAKVTAPKSERKVKTGLNHYKDFFNLVFKNLGGELPSVFKYKAAIILDKKLFLEELKNQNFTEIDLLKAIPFQWVNKNGKFETPQIPIDPMIYLAPDYETVQEYILDSDIDIESVIFIGKNKYDDNSLINLKRDLRDETVPFSIIIGSEDLKDDREQFTKWYWTSEEMAVLNNSSLGSYSLIKLESDIFYKNVLNFELFIVHLEKIHSIDLPKFNGIKKLLYSLALPKIDGRGSNQIEYIKYLLEREYVNSLKDQLETQNLDPDPIVAELHFEITELLKSFSNKKLGAMNKVCCDFVVIPDRFEDIWNVETSLNVISFKNFERQLSSFTKKRKFLLLSPFMNGVSAIELFKLCKNNHHEFTFICYPEEIDVMNALENRWEKDVSDELNSSNRKELCGISFPKENKVKETENILELIGRISEPHRRTGIYNWENLNSINYKIEFTDGENYILDVNKSVLLESDSYKNRVRVGNLRPNDSVRIYANPSRDILFETAKKEDASGRFEQIEKHAALWKNCLKKFYQAKPQLYLMDDLMKDLSNAGITYNHTANVQTKLDAGIDYLGQDNLSRMTLQIGADVLGMANAESKLGLMLHGGVGLLNNGNMVFNDTYLLRGDDMFALTFGLSPKIKINEHSGILLDWSYAKLYKIDGDLSNYMTSTIGFYYRW